MHKLNIGSGRIKRTNFVNIDKIQFIDGNNSKMVDIVMDIEKEKLPFEDNSVSEIVVDNILEHIDNLLFVMNEFHRVLSLDGVINGIVPVAGTQTDFRDPTHKRHFVKSTFGYFCGQSEVKSNRPKHPKYADYGFLPWIEQNIMQTGELIYFKLKPRKV